MLNRMTAAIALYIVIAHRALREKVTRHAWQVTRVTSVVAVPRSHPVGLAFQWPIRCPQATVLEPVIRWMSGVRTFMLPPWSVVVVLM